MPRPLVALCLVALASPVFAADPTPIDRALALQTALADARDLLTAHKSAEAVALLEKQLATADGSRAFLELLRSAYVAEIKRLQIANSDPTNVQNLRTKLALLGSSVEVPEPVAANPAPTPTPPISTPPAPAAPAPASPVASAPPAPVEMAPAPSATGVALENLRQASDLFNQAKTQPKKFEMAAKLFAAACGGGVELSHEQSAAWAYCRIRIAAERLNSRPDDPQIAADVVAEVTDAARLAPGNLGLQKVAANLVEVAKSRLGPAGSSPSATSPDVIETASFRIRHGGRKELGEAIARAAESHRVAISTRWSGPPGGVWEPKCEIVIHADSESFAKSTGQPAGSNGRAVVKLDGGKAVERRIDLRADDVSANDNALPRELTHIVLADLFPTHAPPRWAEAGMAALAASPTEQDRYLRTAIRCQREGDLLAVGKLLEMPVPTGDQITGWYVGSVSLVDFLVRWKGDKAFTTFLRDSQRYGQASALKRQYGVSSVQELEEAWNRGAVATSRGQAP